MTPSGTEQPTFRFVAQHLNRCATQTRLIHKHIIRDFPAFAPFCKLGQERDIRIQIKNFIHGCTDLQIAARSSEDRIKGIPVTLRTSAPTTTSFLSAEKRTVPRVSVTRNPLVRHSNRSFPATVDV